MVDVWLISQICHFRSAAPGREVFEEFRRKHGIAR
jgi:hypothetical protein